MYTMINRQKKIKRIVFKIVFNLLRYTKLEGLIKNKEIVCDALVPGSAFQQSATSFKLPFAR